MPYLEKTIDHPFGRKINSNMLEEVFNLIPYAAHAYVLFSHTGDSIVYDNTE
jgi:hypothetical protein